MEGKESLKQSPQLGPGLLSLACMPTDKKVPQN